MISKNKFGAIFVGAVLVLSVIAISETFRLGYAQSVEPDKVNARLKPGTSTTVIKTVTTGELPPSASFFGVFPDASDCRSQLQITFNPAYFTEIGGNEAVIFEETIRVPEDSTPWSLIQCEVSFWQLAMDGTNGTVEMDMVMLEGDLIATQLISIKVLRPFTCHGEVATIVGTQGDDTGRRGGILGTEGPDVIVALGGKDSIFSFGGDDIICAGDGNDNVTAGPGNDKVILGKGDDFAFLEGGNDIAFGGPGNDEIFGGDGNDYLGGGPGDDRLHGEAGDDRLNGLDGFDFIIGGLGDEVRGDICKSGIDNLECENIIMPDIRPP